MDSDALFHVKQLFWQGSYNACIKEAESVSLSDLSEPESLSRALYSARSSLALTPPSTSSALAILEPALSIDGPVASARAVKAFAEYLDAEEKEAKVEELRDLLLEYESEEVDEDQREEERVVRCIAGTAFILEGEVEEAYATLTEGCGKTDLECTALLVQLLLSIHRKDMASAAYQSAKGWADDALLVQIMEAWIGLKTGSRSLQQACYLYEELYQAPGGRTPTILAGHAAAHLMLGHIDEAKADIMEAMQSEGGKKDVGVLTVGASLGMDGVLETLTVESPNHPYVLDLEAKSKAFDEAAAKFAISA